MTIELKGGLSRRIKFNASPTINFETPPVKIGGRKPLPYATPVEVQTARHLIIQQSRKGELPPDQVKRALDRLKRQETKIGIYQEIYGDQNAVQVIEEEASHPITFRLPQKISTSALAHPAHQAISLSPEIQRTDFERVEVAKKSGGIRFNRFFKRKETPEVVNVNKPRGGTIFDNIRLGGRKDNKDKLPASVEPNIQDTQPIKGLSPDIKMAIIQATRAKPVEQIFLENGRAYNAAQIAREKLIAKEGEKLNIFGSKLKGDSIVPMTEGIGIFAGGGTPPAIKKEDNPLNADNFLPYEDLVGGDTKMYVAPGGRLPTRILNKIAYLATGYTVGTLVLETGKLQYRIENQRNPHDLMESLRSIGNEKRVKENIIRISNEYPEEFERLTSGVSQDTSSE